MIHCLIVSSSKKWSEFHLHKPNYKENANTIESVNLTPQIVCDRQVPPTSFRPRLLVCRKQTKVLLQNADRFQF